MVLNRYSHSDSYQTTTSAFRMYLIIKPITHILSLNIFNLKTVNFKQICTTIVEGELVNPFKSFFLKSDSTKVNFVCKLKSTNHSFVPYPSVYVEELVFSGANTLESQNNEGCHYGGVSSHMLYTNSSLIDTALSENMKHFSWFPDQASNIELFVIWFSGHSHGMVNGSIRHTYCPSAHLSSNSILSHFDEVKSCQIYVYYKTSCNVRLGNQKESFGPGLFEIKVPSKLQCISTQSHNSVDCKSETITWSFDKIQLIYSKSTHKRHLFKSYIDIFLEVYSLLHNLTVSTETCLQSPVGVLLVINKCGTYQPFVDVDTSGVLLNLSTPCNVEEFTRPTFYHMKPVSADIVLFITVKMHAPCDPLCHNKTITIHEVIPDEGIVYQYNFSFTIQFKWHTHRKQGGFSFTVHPQNNSKCYAQCLISMSNVATELIEDTPGTNKCHYKTFPIR